MPRRLLNVLPHAVALLCLLSCAEDLPDKAAITQRGAKATRQSTRTPEHSRVLLVHSYHPEYPWVSAITRGVCSILDEHDVEIEIYYMDTKRKTDEAWKRRAGELASLRLAELNPDVVITADDNAQQYFAMNHLDGPTPFVFCGVNADPSKYGFPASNATGIIERPDFRGTLECANEIRPVRTVAVLSSDDPTSRGALNFMKQELVDVEVVEWALVGTLAERMINRTTAERLGCPAGDRIASRADGAAED